MNQNDNKDGMSTSMFLWVVALVIALFVVPAIYAARAGVINGALLSLAKVQLKSFLPFSQEAQQAWQRIMSADPASLTWETMQAVLRYTGRWIRWPYAVLLVMLGAVSVFMGRTGGLVRRLNMESLLKNNAESFPCLWPVVGRGTYLLSPESYDSGYWRIAQSPIQFAVEHGLLIDRHGTPFAPEQALRRGLADTGLPAYGQGHFDEKKAAAVLRGQLGAAFPGFEALAPARKALACAFLVYASGDKKECVSLLNAVSGAYVEQETPSCPLLTQDDFQKRLAALWEKHQKIASEPLLLRHSAFELPWFMALLTRARHKGVLASSQFLWLRPLDRSLWYALNQCGGRAAWAEGFAAWAHYAAEEKAKKALAEPHIAQAVRRLRDSLSAQGWLTDTAPGPVAQLPTPDSGLESAGPKAARFEAADASIEPPPDRVYAAAEDDPEDYDANNDKQLAREEF